MKITTTILALATCFQVFAIDKVIYGEDDRVHLNDSENALYKELARSTSAMIPNNKLESQYDGLLTLIKGKTLEQAMKVCKEERFSQVMTAANCSGFLVAPNQIVTAGHCIRSEADCANNKWVFDFRQDLLGEGETDLFVDSKNVYSCKKIISQSLSRVSKNDYALIELDRNVEDRTPLKFRSEGKIETGDPLVVIGHPSGLPTIIADGANVRKNDNDFFFQANLDTFGGNSGSAVFNAKTHVIEGILVRGERDYKFDSEAGCYRVFECENDKCRGEDVTRITVIPELAPGMTPEEPEEEELPDFPFNPAFDFDFEPSMSFENNQIFGTANNLGCNPFLPGSCPESLFSK